MKGCQDLTWKYKKKPKRGTVQLFLLRCRTQPTPGIINLPSIISLHVRVMDASSLEEHFDTWQANGSLHRSSEAFSLLRGDQRHGHSSVRRLQYIQHHGDLPSFKFLSLEQQNLHASYHLVSLNFVYIRATKSNQEG